MRSSISRIGRAVVAAIVALSTFAGEPTTTVRGGDKAPIELVHSGEVVLRLRPVAKIALEAETNPDPRVLYPFVDGAKAGQLEVVQPFDDARGSEIAAGKYELQYRIQPPLKEHVDTTEHRDFLLLRSEGGEGKKHPLVLSLTVTRDAAGTPPRLRDSEPLTIEFDLGGQRVALVLSD